MASRKVPTNRVKSWDTMTVDEKKSFVGNVVRNFVFERRNGKDRAGFYDFTSSSGKNVYRGARKGKHNEDWLVSKETADKELSDSLATLRYRSRQLCKDNGIAEGTVLTYVGMAIGEGPKITSRAKGKRAAAQVQKVLDEWVENCDTTGEKNFTDILEDVVTGSCDDGDVLINLPLDKEASSNTVQTRVQLLEADRITTPMGKTRDDNTVRHGVKYKTNNKVEGYYVRKLGMSENSHSYSYILNSTMDSYEYMKRLADDGRQVTWLFKRPTAISRPGQSRQTPLFASCIDLMKDLEDLLDAHIVGTRVAACLMAFIKSDSPEGLIDAILEDPGESTQLTDKYGQKYSKLQPASIIPLRAGEEVQYLDPKRDNSGTEPLIVRIAKLLSMKVRIPYPILFLDLSEINYSSYRGGILEARRVFKRFRKALEKKVIIPILKSVITEAYLKGLLPAVKDLTEDVLIPRVDFPAWGYIDQEKETKAEALGIKEGLTSHQRVAAEHGHDWEEILEEEILYKVKKREFMDKHGVKEEKPPVPGQPPPGQPEEGDGKEEKESDYPEDKKEAEQKKKEEKQNE